MWVCVARIGSWFPLHTADGRLNFLGSAANMPKHCVADLRLIKYKRAWAWVMDSPLAYDVHKPYVCRRGAIICLHLSKPADKASPAVVKEPDEIED